jgi:integrase
MNKENSLNDIEKFLRIKKANGKSSETIKTYRKQLKLILKTFGKKLENIKLDEFLDYLEGYEKQRTKNNKIAILKEYYNVMDRKKKLDEYKVLKPKRVKINHVKYKKRVVSESEYKTILNYANNPRNKAIIELLYATGFRRGEILSINYGDIKLNHDRIYISCNDSKTETREIPIFIELPNVQNWLKIYHPTKKDESPLFTTQYKGKINRMKKSAFNELINQLCKKANIKHIKPHDFKHTKATRLAKKGYPEYVINLILGWSENSKQINNYNHNKMKDYEEIIKGKSKPVKTFDQLKKENEEEIKELKEEMKKIHRIMGNVMPMLIKIGKSGSIYSFISSSFSFFN